jgi:hypothetical protein
MQKNIDYLDYLTCLLFFMGTGSRGVNQQPIEIIGETACILS